MAKQRKKQVKEEVVPEPEKVEKVEVVPEPEKVEVVPEPEEEPEEVPEKEPEPEEEPEEVPEKEPEPEEEPEEGSITTMDDAPSSMLDKDGVIGILTSEKLSMEEKLKEIHTKAEPTYATLTGKLLGYQEEMGVGRINSSLGAGKQYDLLNTLQSVINTEDYSEFKTKFDIVNMTYNTYKASGYKDTMLFRFSELWTWNDKDLVTFQHLNTVIGILCDLSTRKANLPKIDMMKALDSDEVNLSETAAANIQKYYK